MAHAQPCIENKYGIRKPDASQVETMCYLPPKAISSQRKFKRRCLGIHVLPIMFDRGAEILPGLAYRIGLRMRYANGEPSNVETVWGGGGLSEEVSCSDAGRTKFMFSKWKDGCVRSSVTCGQMPQLYYV